MGASKAGRDRMLGPKVDESMVNGDVAPGFEEVERVFIENFARRREYGAASAIYHRGEKVVDLWGGYRDLEKRAPWEEDTLVLQTGDARRVDHRGGPSHLGTQGQRSPGRNRILSGLQEASSHVQLREQRQVLRHRWYRRFLRRPGRTDRLHVRHDQTWLRDLRAPRARGRCTTRCTDASKRSRPTAQA